MGGREAVFPRPAGWNLRRRSIRRNPRRGFVSGALAGLAAWQEDILFPAPPPAADAEAQTRWARAVEVSRFFGGTPQAPGGGAEVAAPPRTLPAVEMPAVVTVTPRRKKHKEGC